MRAGARRAGVETFQLLWDDIEHTLNCPEDEELYGQEERPSGAAQAEFSNRFARRVRQPGPLVVCPMGYAGTGDSPYRRAFAPRLDSGIVVYWTGPEVVSLAIRREALDVRGRTASRGHELLLWDNYPVNDFDAETLFLGPLRGRDPRLADGQLRGIIANAMVQASRRSSRSRPSPTGRATLSLRPARVVRARASRPRRGGARSARRAGAPTSTPPDDVAALVESLALGVDAATGAALLEPFV